MTREKDKLEGKLKEAIGAGRERVGEMTDNEEMEARGNAQKNEGKAQGMVGEAKETLDEAKDKANELKEKVTES